MDSRLRTSGMTILMNCKGADETSAAHNFSIAPFNPQTYFLFMSFTPLENAEMQSLANEFLAKRRPPVAIRHKVNLAYRIKGQSIEIFEIRPRLLEPHEIIEEEVAKATYVRKQDVWKVFWMRADLKWHGYEPRAKVKTLQQFFKLVDEDKYGCFWG